MKVLLAYEWCQVGGVEAFMASLGGALSARGHTCEFFFFQRGPAEKFLPAHQAAHFGQMADLLTLARARGYDVVHANSSDWRLGISAVRTAGPRLVVTAHGMVVPGWNSTNCDGFACVSRWQADEQRAFTDLPVRTIYNGVDTDKFKPARDAAGEVSADSAARIDGGSPVVAWVGRATDLVHKRIDRLAAVAPLLRREGLRLWIADPYGPEEVGRVAPEAARVLRGEAEFWGEVSKERLPDFYREVAATGGCVLSTSAREGFGLVVAEAQACGCPAVGPDVVGINEVVRPERGGVLYPSDARPDEVAALVARTIRDGEGMGRRRAQCSRFARERFSLARMADDYVSLYREALAREQSATLGARARMWLAPLTGWGDYVERRWTAGLRQYEASLELAGRGEWAAASTVARLSFVTSPTLYAKPRRLAHLFKTISRAAAGGRAAGRGAADGGGARRPVD